MSITNFDRRSEPSDARSFASARFNPRRKNLPRDFWQVRDRVDSRGNPESAFRAVFHSRHRRLATYPSPFSVRQLGRQHEHHFQWISLADSGFGVKEYAAQAQVAGLSGMRGVPRRLDRDRNFQRNAFTRPAFRHAHHLGLRRVSQPDAAKTEKSSLSSICNRQERPESNQSQPVRTRPDASIV